MKIAMVSDYYPQFGTQVVQKIINCAKSSGFDFFVISSRHDPYGHKLSGGLNIEDGVTVYRVKSSHMKLAGTPYPLPYGMLWSFRRIIAAEKPDVIHIHFPVFPGAWISAFMATKRKVPVVTTCHGFPEGSGVPILTAASEFIVRFPMKYCLQQSKVITAVSQHTADMIASVNHIPSEKIEVISNGVDINTFRPYQRRSGTRFAWSNGERGKVVGFIGHVRHTKGIRFLVESAARIIKGSDDKVIFVIAGEGPARQALMNEVLTLGLETHFFFPGQISVAQLPDFYNSLDLLVQPSLAEGMPQTVLEAMSCGKPVVASNVGGLLELVFDDENGYLVNPSSPNEIADRVLGLVNRPDLMQEFGRRSRQIIEEKFELAQLCRRYLDVYKRVQSSSL